MASFTFQSLEPRPLSPNICPPNASYELSTTMPSPVTPLANTICGYHNLRLAQPAIAIACWLGKTHKSLIWLLASYLHWQSSSPLYPQQLTLASQTLECLRQPILLPSPCPGPNLTSPWTSEEGSQHPIPAEESGAGASNLTAETTDLSLLLSKFHAFYFPLLLCSGCYVISFLISHFLSPVSCPFFIYGALFISFIFPYLSFSFQYILIYNETAALEPPCGKVH